MGMSAGDEARIRRELASRDCRIFYEIQASWLRELFAELDALRNEVASYHCRRMIEDQAEPGGSENSTAQ